MPSMSLIINVFNRVDYLRKSLISVLNQSMQPDEIILSDDGSTEDIAGRINDLVIRFKCPVKFVTQENKGFRLARCRNNAVRISSGELLVFNDQDLVLTQDYLKTFAANAKDNLFLTSYPVRLDKEQTEKFSEDLIRENSFWEILLTPQLNKIRKQYRKDYMSNLLHKFKLVEGKPKLRGGACAINKADYMKVNGYDENFIGWGNEDDDMRRRLYAAGINGFNPSRNDFPIHLHHEPFHINGNRINKTYNDARAKQIKAGDYICKNGLNNPDDSVKVSFSQLN